MFEGFWLGEVTGKLSLVGREGEMNPHGTELGWVVVAHWDTERRSFVCSSPKSFEVSLLHSVGEVENPPWSILHHFFTEPQLLLGVGLLGCGRSSQGAVAAPFLPLPVSLPLSNPHSALSVLPTKAAASEQLRLQSSQNNKRLKEIGKKKKKKKALLKAQVSAPLAPGLRASKWLQRTPQDGHGWVSPWLWSCLSLLQAQEIL